MDKLSEKQIINCSRCALCMDVCPIYKVKQIETYSLRGKLLQLLGIMRGDINFEKKVAYNIDLCLACGKCKNACPSGIDAIKIFGEVKAENSTLFENFINSGLIFKLKMLFLKIVYKVKYPLGKNAPHLKLPAGEKKVVHFKGCATKAIGSFLQLKNEKFSCCGMPFYVKGKFKLWEKYKKRNIELIKKSDVVVFDCATCYETVSKYEELDENERKKLVYFTDFYKNKEFSFPKNVKVAFHKPCHLNEVQFEKIKELLKSVQNVEVMEYDEEKECCGFGGDFFIRHPKTAHTLALRKIEGVIKSGADVVITTCPMCLWSLKYGIKAKRSALLAYDLAEFLGKCR